MFSLVWSVSLMLKHLRGFSVLAVYKKGVVWKTGRRWCGFEFVLPELKPFHFYFPLLLLFGNQQREPQAFFFA